MKRLITLEIEAEEFWDVNPIYSPGVFLNVVTDLITALPGIKITDAKNEPVSAERTHAGQS